MTLFFLKKKIGFSNVNKKKKKKIKKCDFLNVTLSLAIFFYID
jgi:hypothetical protein